MSRDIHYLYNSLLCALGQEYERYEELFEIIGEEAKVLKGCRLQEILDSNAKQERILLSISMASEMRAGAIKNIITHLNLEPPVTIHQIIACARPQIRQDLIQYHEKFSALKSRIEQFNETNKRLIHVSLSYVSNTLNYINILTSSKPHYDHCGQIKAGNLQGRLISQEG